MVKVGDTLPDVPVQENGDLESKVDLSKELKNGYLIGIPAAFSPTCTQGHIPKYVTQKSEGKVSGDVFVISVNDAFVMKAWADQLDPNGKSGVRFVNDPAGDFLNKLDLIFDATAFFGNPRSNRFAMVIKDGKVDKIEVEPDPTKVTVSSADKIL